MEQNLSTIEHPPKKNRRILWVLLLLPLLVIVVIYGYNYITLQEPLNTVIENDSRNKGIKVSVTYDSYINISSIEYSLEEFSGLAPVDIFRVFLQYAEALKSRNFDYVILSLNGKPKFKIEGSYFKQLGSEYSSQNPAYTIRTFPENLYKMDGSKAYGQWTGGLLGVLKQQMEDFNDFIKKWTETN